MYRILLNCIVCIWLICLPIAAPAQLNSTKFEQLDSLMKVEKRAVIVFIHTSWCKFCQQFQETTLKNKNVQEVLNDDFYFVDIDAVAKHDIVFRGHIFKYDPVYRVHDLAKELGAIDGRVSYPTIAFLNENLEILYQHDGYLSDRELVPVLEKLR